MTLPNEIYEAIGSLRDNTADLFYLALAQYCESGRDLTLPRNLGKPTRAIWNLIKLYIDEHREDENAPDQSLDASLDVSLDVSSNDERKEQRKEKETLLPAPLYKEKEKIIEKKERGKIIFISTHAREKENFEEFCPVESDDVVNEKGAAAKKQEAAGRAREDCARQVTSAELKELVAHFNMRMPGSFQREDKLSPANIADGKAAIRNVGLEELKNAIDRLAAIPFFNGENSRGWVATFPWFISNDHFYKIINNEYQEDKHIDVDRLRRAKQFARLSQKFLNQPEPQFDDSVW